MSTRLILVRAGDASLHKDWGTGDWDLLNVYYGDNPPPPSQGTPPLGTLPIKGGKWDGIYKAFLARGDLLTKYKTIWLPDDDIETSAEEIEKMFALHEKHNLLLSQPALTYDSFVLYASLLQNPEFILRYSNFVEIMMPCFDSTLLARILPFFEDNTTGTFLDSIWHRFCPKPFQAAAILDSVAMRHTRPVGGAKSGPITTERAKMDGADLMKKVSGLPKRLRHNKLPRPLFYGGVLKNERAINGTTKTGARVFWGYLKQLGLIKRHTFIGSGRGKRGRAFMFSRFVRHILLHHIFNKPDLSSYDHR